MSARHHARILCTIASLATIVASPAAARGIYAQIVASFPTTRKVVHTYLKTENAVVLEFKNTSPAELTVFDTYDERLIRRVIFKDMTPLGTEVKLILRDRNVKAVVSDFSEPFRIAIDIYDADFEEERDLTTSMPLVAMPQGEGTAPRTSHDKPLIMLESVPANSSSDTDLHQPPMAPGASTGQNAKHQLLQPPTTVLADPESFEQALRNAGDSIGKAWTTYPPYVYRLQTAAHELKAKAPTINAQLMDSTQMLADYAGSMYNMGHEAKALVAYQQVLHRDPTVFDRDALHLWKFAETHLGQGNLTLARGYYEAIVEKHPESPLAAFARLRTLDVAAIRLVQSDRQGELPALGSKLAQISARHGGELKAQLALRRAFWSDKAQAPVEKPSGIALPLILPDVGQELAANLGQVESARTAFFAASLLLTDMLQPDTPWRRETGSFADSYFKRFSGSAAEPYRSQIERALTNKLNAILQAKVTDGKLVEAIDDFESVPKALRRAAADPRTSWALAESYRKLGQPEQAAEFYAAAAKTDAEGPDRFKAEFWLGVMAGQLANDGRTAKKQNLASIAQEADKRAWVAWQRLKDGEKRQLMVAYKDPFESTINAPAKLRTGPKIVLATWTTRLGTNAPATTGDDNDWNKAFSPSGSAVIVLSDLGRRFRELGMIKEARIAVGLLQQMKPADFADDQAAKAIWANQLVQLAEDYRRANQYLDAGRLFALVGSASENWPGRAEALYKGGLLLYRAGRREEAVAAFKQSAEDGNNLMYANLAKERLAQLQ